MRPDEAAEALGAASGGIGASGVLEFRAARKVGLNIGVKRRVQPGAELPDERSDRQQLWLSRSRHGAMSRREEGVCARANCVRDHDHAVVVKLPSLVLSELARRRRHFAPPLALTHQT